MDTPRFRSVAVHWPRLFAGVAVTTGVLVLAASWKPLAFVVDSFPLLMLMICVLMAGVVGVGRPTAEFEVQDDGVLRREGMLFSLFGRKAWMPWGAIDRCEIKEEMDGSRSLALRTRHGTAWKLWEKFGSGDLDAFRREVVSRMERAPAGGPDVLVTSSAWDGGAARAIVAVLAVGWIALAVLAATGPAQGRGYRAARLAAMALLLAPLLWRAFVVRRAPHPAR